MSAPAISVRLVQQGDLPALLMLTRMVPEAPWWSEVHVQQIVAAESAPQGLLLRRGWVAIANGALLGFIVLQALQIVSGAGASSVSASSACALECEIEAIVVAPDHRRRGIGKQLLQAALAWCRQHRVSAVRLEVRSSNQPAHALYAQFGFVNAGLRRHYYESPSEDAVLMELCLPPAN